MRLLILSLLPAAASVGQSACPREREEREGAKNSGKSVSSFVAEVVEKYGVDERRRKGIKMMDSIIGKGPSDPEAIAAIDTEPKDYRRGSNREFS